MDEELSFAEFFNARLKQKGYSLRRLSDLSGIALKHLENMSRGETQQLPAAPYLRGYIATLGQILDFDPQFWWERLRLDSGMTRSGASDTLPTNRFARKSPIGRSAVAAIIVLVLILGYVLVRLPSILGTPQLSVTSPAQNGITSASENFTLAGTLQNGNEVTINGQQVQLNSDGTWSQDVLLQPGLNPFEIISKKFLGRQTSIVEQIFYEPSATTTNLTMPVLTTSTASSSASSTSASGTAAQR